MGHLDLQPDRARGTGDPKSVIDRLGQVLWILDHLDDLASDLSAVHGVRDMTVLSGPALCKLAFRLSAYQTVIQARYAEQQQDTAPQPQAAAAQRGSRAREQVAPTRTALQASPVMGSLFSFG